MRLQGKRAFITAAGQGIGRAIAEAYLREGADVTATDLNDGLLAGLDGARCFALDVTDRAALQSAVADAAPDILVNCAGVVNAGSIADATDDEFDFAMNLNVRAQFHSMQAALPGMVERGGGSIVNIASVASTILAAPNRYLYATSKAAVIASTKSVAVDYVQRVCGPMRSAPARWTVPACMTGCVRPGIMKRRLRPSSRVNPWGASDCPKRLRILRSTLALMKVGSPPDRRM